MFKEENLHDLSGKKAEVSFLPVQPENLGEHTEKDRDRAIAKLDEMVALVRKFLATDLNLNLINTDEPQFIFIDLDQKAEFDEVHGIIYISNRYLKNLLELEPIGIHELIHFYADRLFDFSKIDDYLIKGRKLGLSIRYSKESGEAIDGFGVFDEVLVMHLTKEICTKYKLFYFSKSEEPYLFEQQLLYKYISKLLPLKLRLWDSENRLIGTEIKTFQEIIEILKKSTFARLSPNNHKRQYRNSGRLLRKLFEDKAIKPIAINTRRREPSESQDKYKERILSALLIE